MKPIVHFLGGFYLNWALFELNIEMLCRRELGLSERKNHIVFSSLSFSAKLEIAISLLMDSEDPKREKILSAMRKIPQIARRNHITHSIFAINKDLSLITFTKREIVNGLKSKVLKFDNDEMRAHFTALNEACGEFETLLGFSGEDRRAYTDAMKVAI